jgi:hypothetical protein
VFSQVSEAFKWTIWGETMWSLQISLNKFWDPLTNILVRDYLFFIEHFWSLLFDHPEKVFAAALTLPDLLSPSAESRSEWNKQTLKIHSLVLQNKLQIPTPVEWKMQQISSFALTPFVPVGSGRLPVAVLPRHVCICTLQLSPDAKHLAALDSFGMICFYRALDGKMFRSIQTAFTKIEACCWVKNSHFCIGASKEGVIVWKVPVNFEDQTGLDEPQVVFSSTLYCPPQLPKSTSIIQNDV